MVTHGMISAMCQAYTKRGSESEGGNSVEKSNQKKGRNKEKRKGRKRGKKEKKGREKEGEERRLTTSSSDLPAFRRSELFRLRIKAHLLNEDYAPKGGDSSSFGYFHPKVCLAMFLP